MHAIRTPLRSFLPVMALALFMGGVPPVNAQQTAPALAVRSEPFDFTFPGGPPAQLVRAMEQQAGRKLNVVLPTNVTQIMLPPMELRGVTAEAVFNTLNRIPPTGGELAQWTQVENVWLLQLRTDGGSDRRRPQVFYVGDLLRQFKIEDITTAVQSTWELAPRKGKGELKYHQETQLLIALAEKDQLDTVKELLAELKQGLPQGGSGATASAEAKPKVR